MEIAYKMVFLLDILERGIENFSGLSLQHPYTPSCIYSLQVLRAFRSSRVKTVILISTPDMVLCFMFYGFMFYVHCFIRYIGKKVDVKSENRGSTVAPHLDRHEEVDSPRPCI